MKTISKLLLTTAILATGAMAGGDPEPVEGTFAAGLDIEADSNGTIVARGTTVQNTGSVNVVNGIYTDAGAIDVRVTSSSVYGKLMGDEGQTPADAAHTPGTDGGTVTGNIARHWLGGGLNWGETSTNSNIWVISADSTSGHGFISNGLVLTGATIYEVCDGTNTLARLYRNIDNSANTKIEPTAEGKYAFLSVESSGSAISTTSLGNGEYGTLGTIVYTTGSGPASVVPNSAFEIDLSKDSDSSDSYEITANLSNASSVATSQGKTAAGSLKINTVNDGTAKEVTLSGKNTDFGGALDMTGTINIGRVADNTDSENPIAAVTSQNALGGITNIDAHAFTGGVSELTLPEGAVATAGDWTFYGGSRLTAAGRITLSAGNTITFGAEES